MIANWRLPIVRWRTFAYQANRQLAIINRQWIGCGGRIRTFDSRINNPVPYQLGYATRECFELRVSSFEFKAESTRNLQQETRNCESLAAAARVELAHPRLQDERSVIQLSYAAIWWTGRDSNPHKKFAGLLCCRLHHQPRTLSIADF